MGGGCNIVESILVPCRLKYITGGGWVPVLLKSELVELMDDDG